MVYTGILVYCGMYCGGDGIYCGIYCCGGWYIPRYILRYILVYRYIPLVYTGIYASGNHPAMLPTLRARYRVLPRNGSVRTKKL